MTMTMNHISLWIALFQSGSVNDLEQAISNAAQDDLPPLLLHWACQYSSHCGMVEHLIRGHLPPAVTAPLLTLRDDQGKIPLHHVCQQRSCSTLAMLQVLLPAAPDTILMRMPYSFESDEEEHNTFTSSPTNDRHCFDEHEGLLPAIVAHNHGASPKVVQYLLRCQLQAQQGLVLSHEHDMMYVRWNEDVFWEHISNALLSLLQQQQQHQQQQQQHQVPSKHGDPLLYRIVLKDCRLSCTAWQLLQTAIAALPVGSLQELRLIHLYIWHSSSSSTFTTTRRMHNLQNHKHKHNLQQQQDISMWKDIVDRQKHTLQTLELPHFYALTPRTVSQIAQWLADQEFPHLQVLDARCPSTCHSFIKVNKSQPPLADRNRGNTSKDNLGTRNKKKSMACNLATFLSMPTCKLQSLAMESLTPREFQKILQDGLQWNRSVNYLHIDSIRNNDNQVDDDDNDEDNDNPKIPWKLLQTTLVQTLQRNSTLERIIAPRPLMVCRQVQLYLQLNRHYHRRDIGHWSPALVAHVLAKTLVANNNNNNNNNNDDDDDTKNERRHFPTRELILQHDPRSTMFHILQERPDIVISNNPQ